MRSIDGGARLLASDQEGGVMSQSRTMRRRRLARALRQYRATSGMSGEDAAKALLCGSGTISRMENGDSSDPLRVRDALRLYGAPEAVEDEAAMVSMLEGECVPGLIQTRAYARALISTWDPHVSDDEVDRLLSIRMDRQERLLDDRPLK